MRVKPGQTLIAIDFVTVCAALSCPVLSSLRLYKLQIPHGAQPPAKMVEKARVTESRKGMHAVSSRLGKRKLLIQNSVDDTYHQHEIPFRPHHSQLQSQEARLQISSCSSIHRCLPSRRTRRARGTRDSQAKNRVFAPESRQRLLQRSALLRLLVQTHAFQPRRV